MNDKRILSGWIWRGVFALVALFVLLVMVYACAAITRTVNGGVTF